MTQRMTGALRVALLAATGAAVALSGSASGLAAGSGINKINHVVVIYQENWSFDSLYGRFPGANGIDKAGTIAQVGKDGTPITKMPQAIDNNVTPEKPDSRFPADLPLGFFDASKYVPADGKTGDIVHRYYQEQYQMDGGKNDRFLAGSDNPGLVMSYYDASSLPEGQLAKQYVMADNMFHSAFGGSFLNHQWLVCACTPAWDTAAAPVPEAKRTVLDSDKLPAKGKDGFITAAPDNFVINTSYSVNKPHPAKFDTDPSIKGQLVPALANKTIGDELNDKGVAWKWYSGGWDDALAGKADSNFQFHHQPFTYYKTMADGTQAKKDHLQDELYFFADVEHGTLPAVSFIKPLGPDNEHPGYASLLQGQKHVASIVNSIRNSPYWQDTAIIITYDENGGRYDHVAAPKGDRWGPGVRVPGIIISPYAKKGIVDHTQYETVSILKFIENRWGVAALGTRDAAASGFDNAFDFNLNPAPASSGGGDTGSMWPVALVAVVVLVVAAGAVLLLRGRRA